MSDPVFVYTTYINTTPERLWRALTEPTFTRQYWSGLGMRSDWRTGSPVALSFGPDQDFEDLDQVVLESEPYRVLSYTWHTYQPDRAARYGMTEDELATVRSQPRSKVTFRIQEDGGQGVRAVRLTVIHDDFAPDSPVYRAVSGERDGNGGWPELFANLKTFLETGAPLPSTNTSTSEAHAATPAHN